MSLEMYGKIHAGRCWMRYGSGYLLLVCKELLWSMQPGYDVYERALFAALSGNVTKVFNQPLVTMTGVTSSLTLGPTSLPHLVRSCLGLFQDSGGCPGRKGKCSSMSWWL